MDFTIDTNGEWYVWIGHYRMWMPQVLELVQQGTQNKTELEDPASVPTNGGKVPNCGMDL